MSNLSKLQYFLIVILLLSNILFFLRMIRVNRDNKELSDSFSKIFDKLHIIDEEIIIIKNDIYEIKESACSEEVRNKRTLKDTLKLPASSKLLGISLNNRFIPDLVPIQADYAISQGFTPYHQSIDFAASTGTSVYAAAAGIVIACYEDKYLGNVVLIDHFNSYKTLYAHLHEFKANINDFVEKGQEIGLVGNTGYSSNPHLHFQIYFHNDPVDPNTLMKISKFKN